MIRSASACGLIGKRSRGAIRTELNRCCGSNVYDVLNFSGHGVTIMDNLVQYLMFAEPLRPDLVLYQGGPNDIELGLKNDHAFVELCQLTYAPYIEIMAVKRSGAARTLSHKLDTEHHPSLEAVISAFILRVSQFQRIVEAGGGQFVFSFQTTPLGKREMAATERVALSPTNSSSCASTRRYAT